MDLKRFALVSALMALASAGFAQAPYTVVHSFGGLPQYPSPVVQANDGFLYGATNEGGMAGGYGAIYKSDSSGNVTVIHAFARVDGSYPRSPLVQGTDGALYGTSWAGGPAEDGTVFKITTDGVLTTLHFFGGPDGASTEAGLVEGTDGFFYGTTPGGGDVNGGVVFKIDGSGGFTTLYSFGYEPDGNYPEGGLTFGSDGALYGTTYFGGTGPCDGGCGTVVRITTTGAETVLHSFVGTDGSHPTSGLVLGSDGFLYGSTPTGTSNHGTMFKIDTAGHLTTLHSFGVGDGPAGRLAEAIDGSYYGTTAATIFRLGTDGVLATLHNFSGDEGLGPSGLMRSNDGYFYGTCWQGGSPGGHGFGSLYRISGAGEFTSLHSFSESDPAYPDGVLARGSDGALYGTTYQGGALEQGAVFRVDASGSVDTLHSFDFDTEGANASPLIQASDGNFYGTTGVGGVAAGGVVFKVDPSGNLAVLHAFDCNVEGCGPGSLVEGTDAALYGMTSVGGSCTLCGTVFRIDTAGNLTTLHFFNFADGQYGGSLIRAADGYLYGTTYSGGSALCYGITNGCGTLFRIDQAGAFTSLHSFDGYDGYNPNGGLLLGSDGKIYGTTGFGGTGTCFGIMGCGTIFRWSDAGLETVHKFSGRDGMRPNGGLIEGADGGLYGTTQGFGYVPCEPADGECGSIFRVDGSGRLSTVRFLGGLSGGTPAAGLTVGSDGFYGTTYGDGPGGLGVVFRLDTTLWVTALTPASGPASGGTSVSLAGFGFDPAGVIAIGGVPATGVQFLDPNHILAVTPALTPGTLSDVTVTNPGSAAPGSTSSTVPGAFLADFLDVPQGDIFHDSVETIFRAGVTAGCGGGNYCRDAAGSRKQMAVFVLKAKEGSSYVPPPAAGIFADVPPSDSFAPWIEELYHRGVVAGCGDGTTYCPNDPVLRQQMAVFLLKALFGPLDPPACNGEFTDVPCSSPFAGWIEELFRRGIAAGCGGGNYCPTNPTTRGQMSAFLVKTFGLS